MATRKLKFKAPVRWAKVFEDNRDMQGYEGANLEFNGKYSIDVGLDDAQMAMLKASRSMKQGSAGEDGLTWVKFERKHEDRFEWSSGAPKVVKADGSEWDFISDGEIGNGSTCTVYVSVYDTSRKAIVGTRLDKVQVDDFVPKTSVADSSDEYEEVPF